MERSRIVVARAILRGLEDTLARKEPGRLRRLARWLRQRGKRHRAADRAAEAAEVSVCADETSQRLVAGQAGAMPPFGIEFELTAEQRRRCRHEIC